MLTVPHPDVAARPELAALVAAYAYDGMLYQCTSCGERGHLGEGPEVTVWMRITAVTGHVVMKFAHTGCMTGPGIETIQDSARPMLNPELEAWALPVVIGSMISTRFWSAILVEIHTGLLSLPAEVRDGRQPPGDARDMIMGLGLGLGMHPVSNVSFPPEPADPRWQVELPGGSCGGGVYGPQGLQLIEPLSSCQWPPDWFEMARARGSRCAVYLATRLGLKTTQEQGSLGLQRLNAAARDGRIVGVVATVLAPGGRS